LLAVANEDQRLRILLALDAGLRLGDVVTLKWTDIDFIRMVISRDTRKTGMKVIPPLSDRLATALKKRMSAAKDKFGYIFPDDVARLRNGEKTDKISSEMSALFTAAGIKTHEKDADGKNHLVASFHSLRHTFVSRLMERGVNPYYVQRAVGHSTMTMTAHYDHSAAEEIRRALER
jgi:integrase